MVGTGVDRDALESIAIIGMSCRFPGADSPEKFWRNLHDGIESIYFFSDQEHNHLGQNQAWLNNPNYVKADPCLNNIEWFDASFFNLNARQAELTSPEHRIFLECAWEALEHGGYTTQHYGGSVGVYAGSNISHYLKFTGQDDLMQPTMSGVEASFGNDLNYMSTLVSYHLNLKGPSMMVQTACSTALVAIHMAGQSLLNGECDMALAGAINLRGPQRTGYFYQEGGIFSPDGHCRAFDAKAQGTVPGSGAGIVLLKRLSDALDDGDYIHAVIRGSAINNDGATKVGYSAPSVDGQAVVIADALAIAEIDPNTVTYIEAHGTGTVLGDPIEVAALTDVFRSSTDQKGFCAIGSVKSNVGHLGVAAGIPGLMKVALALENQLIPPSLNFEQPNPKIDFANSPFYVNHSLSEWRANGTPRRAGVSSLGVGGTNAHIVLEEAPPRQRSGPSRPWQLITISAKTRSALDTSTANLADYLSQHPDLNLADVAYTLSIGRQAFNHRRVLICQQLDQVQQQLKSLDPQHVLTQHQTPRKRPIIFMFSGQGAQYLNMARELYQTEFTFREQVDTCAAYLHPLLGLDLRHILYPDDECAKTAAQKLTQTAIAQPALFVIEYALAKLWMSWGICPAAMIGHSIGEYVAATLAGVFSLDAALAIVAKRGQLMQELPPGQMLAIPLPENEVMPLLGESLALAVVNGPSTCVVSGQTEAISALQEQLTSQGINCRPLHTSHGFHSPMMDPILDTFKEQVQQFHPQPPTIPYISNVTGSWITAEAATDPNYWASHLRQTVRFGDGLQVLLQEPAHVFLEVGPGRTLSTLLKQHPAKCPEQAVLTSLHHPKETQSDVDFILNTTGRLWLAGIQIDWNGFYVHEDRHRLPLPTYPFERQRYWLGSAETSSPPSMPGLTMPDLWQSLVTAGEQQAATGEAALDEKTYLETKKWIDRLCIAYINSALSQLGTFKSLELQHDLEDLYKHSQVLPRYHQLVKSWLKALVRVGQLQPEGNSFKRLVPSLEKSDSTDEAIEVLLEKAKECWVETPQMVDFIQLCGENLDRILVGEQEPLELFNRLIYQNQDGEPTQKSPWEDYYRTIMRSIVEKLAQSLSSDATFKILEIGAGTGIATSALLPVLPHERTHYTFTDIGSSFLVQAQQKFADYPFVQYQLLDIEQSPKTQGFPLHEFDIVIAANVLHATQNISETLKNVRSLVAPGGFLLLWEITQPQLNFEVTWGLLMKPFEDQRGDRTLGNPFLSSQAWRQALKDNDFTGVAVFPNDNAFGHSVILAQVGGTKTQSLPSALVPEKNRLDNSQLFGKTLDPKSNVADWFYLSQWKRSLPPFSLSSTLQTNHSECWLIFTNEVVGFSIVEQLQRQKYNVVTVNISNTFDHQKESLPDGSIQHSYTLSPEQKDDYLKLFESLEKEGIAPNHIVHAWTITSLSQPHSSHAQFDQIQSLGFYSLLFLVQTLGKQNWNQDLQLTAISNNMQAVTEEESILYPEKATILGLLKVIPQEYDYIHCRSIDITLTETDSWRSKKLTRQLCAEILAPSPELMIAYRGLQRWVHTVEPITLKAQPIEELPLQQSGAYLIIGGLGSLGLILAEYLARTVQAKLILIGRSSFPAKEQWSDWLSSHEGYDKISCQIRKIQELEALGAEVLTIKADVSSFDQMQAALSQVEQRFGTLNGVIHAVALGAAQLFKPIQDITPADCKLQFQGKIDGLFVLQELLGTKSLDFCLLISSLASLFGGLGHAAYAAANIFMDTFVHQHNQVIPTPWLSVNWDGRKPVSPEGEAIPLVETSSELTILPEEDREIFRHVLAWPQLNQIIVSTRELQPRVDYWTRWELLREQANLREGDGKPHHTRPDLENAYVPPRNATEKILTDIWQAIIGINLVGIHDNYFELGGDSLISIQVMTRIRETFQVDLPSNSLFETPTIAGMASHIDNIQVAKKLQTTAEDKVIDDREEVDL